MTLKVYLRLSDPAARRRFLTLMEGDDAVELVRDAEQADVVIDDGSAARAAAGPAVEAGTALTARELEVLALMAHGLGNKQIGSALGISAHTAKYHVASVLAKLDVQSRTEAVTKGLREGLVPL